MRLAILSNVTVEVLADMLRKEHDVWIPPGFGAWRQTALAVPPELTAFDPEAVFLLLDATRAPYDLEAVPVARAALEAALPHATVHELDLVDLTSETDGCYDARMWQLASMPWSLRGLHALQDEINRLLASMKGPRRKALAVDFDGTLWRGTVGEDGPAGIEPDVALQCELKTLKARGILLVGLSKNNPADVAPVWDDPRMVLKADDFAAVRVNWEPKSANLAATAAALNLGLESFVFYDDNPAERAEMRAALPMVAVPEAPLPPRRLTRLWFPAFRTTDEDRVRTELYHAEAARRDFAAGRALADYLRDLALRAEFHPVRTAEFARVAQLAQKTNQFNVCTNRLTIDDVARCAADPARALWTVHAGDRFGDQGLVAFVCVEIRGACARITDWVMSCRAMNRRLEFAVQAACERALVARGVTLLRAEWRRTPKNAPVAELFDRFGFRRVTDAEDARSYEKDLPGTEPLMHTVALTEEG